MPLPTLCMGTCQTSRLRIVDRTGPGESYIFYAIVHRSTLQESHCIFSPSHQQVSHSALTRECPSCTWSGPKCTTIPSSRASHLLGRIITTALFSSCGHQTQPVPTTARTFLTMPAGRRACGGFRAGTSDGLEAELRSILDRLICSWLGRIAGVGCRSAPCRSIFIDRGCISLSSSRTWTWKHVARYVEALLRNES